MGSNGVLAWRTITQDYTQFGQNHGSTGILMQFFRLPEVFNNVTVSNYIRATLDYFLTIQYPSGNFPTPMKPPFPTVPDILVQWDHGGPAFVPILGEAYLRFGDERYYQSMQKVLDDIWVRGLLIKGLMLCHGITGNSYMMLYAHKIKGDPTYLYRALKFQEFALIHPEISDPTKMIQNYPWAFMASTYQGAISLWSDMLSPSVNFLKMNMPGFATSFL